MVSIKPIITLFSHKTPAAKFIQKPQAFHIKPENLKNLRYAGDELCLSTKKQVISLDEVKALFPQGRLEDNYIIDDIKDLLSRLQTERKIIDLSPELSDKDYSMIQKFMNMDNGRFIEKWKGFSDTDIVPNIQKLALFTRTMRLTRQTNEFLEFDPNRWEMVYEGIVKKPREIIMSMLEYKANSDPINKPLGDNRITKALKEKIDKISDYLNMFTVKKDFIAHRGDKTFNILSGVKYEGQNISLADLMEDFTNAIKHSYSRGTYNKSDVDDFIKKYILNKKIHQKRFMSIGMTESSIKNYAKRIKWRINIPAGTKGASIESYNIERLNEAEFLGQRNGVLKIRDAYYCPKKDLWYFDASLEQNSIDELVVNC